MSTTATPIDADKVAKIATPIDAEKIAKIHALAGQGLTNVAIAEQLGVAESTVRKYKWPNGEAANGHDSRSADLDQIEKLLADRWQRLTLIERLQFFLGRD